MSDSVKQRLGNWLANYLTKPSAEYDSFSPISKDALASTLQLGDVLLVEGKSRVSTAIKYLTQSTWSHVCIFVGESKIAEDKVKESKVEESIENFPLVEADVVEGVIRIPIDKYEGFNLRICRPVGLTDEDKMTLVKFIHDSIGHQYDTKHIFDLLRYLFPTPPVPQRFRRRMLAFGSGDPTKAICSTLVAQAFHAIHYPILPIDLSHELAQTKKSSLLHALNPFTKTSKRLKLQKRHYSHFVPRDFDLSPYFQIIKPTLDAGFDYKTIHWHEEQKQDRAKDATLVIKQLQSKSTGDLKFSRDEMNARR
uniref:lipo-like protein n=1 Tax=Ningiella ruwaisensis TaxID=2364274 RepID=UPI00109EF170|nr:lipo-like protein [Ningiella ruwaisensis]